MVVLISHKTDLLEVLAKRIIYINPSTTSLHTYNCNYEEFQKAHAERIAHSQKQVDLAQQQSDQANKSLHKLRHDLQKRERNLKNTTRKNADQRFIKGKAKESKQKADHAAASKAKRVHRKLQQQEELVLQRHVVAPLHLEGKASSHDTLVTLDQVDFGYDDDDEHWLFRYADAQIMATDKILLQGPNGTGKSTLIKLLMGELEPIQGEIRRQTTKIAYFPQNALQQLATKFGATTAVDFIKLADCGEMDPTMVRQHLGTFGLKGALATRRVGTLSAGQRARLWLAREFLNQSNNNNAAPAPSLLILDEVTEQLDHETTDSLLETLREFGAAVLAISHHGYFLQHFDANQIWKLGHQRLTVEYYQTR